MFEGFLRFGGVEVVNADRTDAYVKAGCIPADVEVEVPGACQGLGEALGHAPYSMPARDLAPWFEPEDPATHWFGGVLPLEVTGLDGTTRTAGVSERTQDGGVVTAVRRATRTIQVSALLVGRDAASVHAGLEWLTSVLHRECEDPTGGCEGATLEAFTTCPAPIADTEDLDAALVSHVQSPGDVWPTSGGIYSAGVFRVTEPGSRGGVFYDGGGPGTVYAGEDLDGGSADSAANPDVVLFGGDPDDVAAGTTDGGGPGATFDGLSDGGEPGTAFETLADGGGVRSYSASAWVASPGIFPCLSEVRAVWTLSPLSGGATVRTGVVDRYGRVLEEDDDRTLPPGTTTIERVYIAPRWDEWRPALWVDEPGVNVALDVRHRPDLDPDACLAPYRRTYANVSLIAGPSVVDVIGTDDCSDDRILQVEWTWSAGDAFRYGDPQAIVSGMPGTTNAAPAYAVPGAIPNFIGAKTASSTACARPTSSNLVCAPDPTYPTFIAPPAAPAVVDTSAPAPSSYVRSMLQLTTSIIRATAGAATFGFVNDGTRKRGIRVRIWPNEGTFTDVVECAWEQEFYINHLPPGGVLTVDAVNGSVTVVCPAAAGVTEDARAVMRGSYGGAFRFPILRCNKRYYIAVDVPASSGALTWSLSLSPREG